MTRSFDHFSVKQVFGYRNDLRTLVENVALRSFCNDVIGDIAGIVSGSTLAVIVAHLFAGGGSAISVVMTAVLSAVTVGGKAIGKTVAMKNSNKIVHIASVIIYSFSRKK